MEASANEAKEQANSQEKKMAPVSVSVSPVWPPDYTLAAQWPQ